MPVNLTLINTKCNEIFSRLTDIANEATPQNMTGGRQTSVTTDIWRARDVVEAIRESCRASIYG